MTQLVDAIRAFEPEFIAIRRGIRRPPEVESGETRTGVVATLTGKRAGQRSIRLRTDLDV